MGLYLVNNFGKPNWLLGNDQCFFWDCKESSTVFMNGIYLCHFHDQQLSQGLINQCDKCGNGKLIKYPLCPICNQRQKRQELQRKVSKQIQTSAKKVFDKAKQISVKSDKIINSKSNKPTTNQRYEPEYSPEWRDQYGWGFHVYVLLLSDKSYYVGHTSDLRSRLIEHRSNQVKSTMNKNPQLAWFLEVYDRTKATYIEANIKEMRDKNPRQLIRTIHKFNDLVRETLTYKHKQN